MHNFSYWVTLIITVPLLNCNSPSAMIRAAASNLTKQKAEVNVALSFAL